MELVLIAVSLAMDALAYVQGLGMKTLRYAQGALIALFFGVFQAVMPLIGWALGKQFERHITSVDHWIAFGLLGYIGWKMIRDALGQAEGENALCPVDQRINYRELLMLSVATSIDALAVGITFAFLQTPIVPAMVLIGSITFVLCFWGDPKPLRHSPPKKARWQRYGAHRHRAEDFAGAFGDRNLLKIGKDEQPGPVGVRASLFHGLPPGGLATAPFPWLGFPPAPAPYWYPGRRCSGSRNPGKHSPSALLRTGSYTRRNRGIRSA